MAKVLIVGASGFVGANISNWLMIHTQHQIVGVDDMSVYPTLRNLQPVVQSNRYNFYVADASNKDIVEKIFRIEKPDYVIVAASRDVLTSCGVAASLHKVKKTVIISSIYDIAEAKYLSAYKEDYPGQFIWARVCNLYGPRAHPGSTLPIVIGAYLCDKPSYIFETNSTIAYSWMYVKDAFYAINALLNDGVPGQIYTIDSGFSYSSYQVINKIANILSISSTYPEVSCPAEKFEIPSAIDIRTLGWQPNFQFAESLEHTVCWYNANRWALDLEQQ